MNTLAAISKTLFDSDEFFILTKDEKGILDAVKYLFAVAFLSNIVNFISWYLLYWMLASKIQLIELAMLSIAAGLNPIWFLLTSSSVLYLVLFAASFAVAGFAYLILKIMKVNADYQGCYKAVAYGMTPAMIFRFIPVVSVLVYIWSITLQAKGITWYVKTDKKTAYAAILPPYLLAFALAAFFASIVAAVKAFF